MTTPDDVFAGLATDDPERLFVDESFSKCKEAVRFAVRRALGGRAHIDIFDADDVAQETIVEFRQALQKARTNGEHIDSPGGLIERIARDTVAAHWRRHKRREDILPSSSLNFHPEDHGEPPDCLIEDISSLPEAWTEVLSSARMLMTTDEQHLYDLRRSHADYKHELAAGVFGVSERTIKRRSKRIDALIRKEREAVTQNCMHELIRLWASLRFQDALPIQDRLLSLAAGEVQRRDFRLRMWSGVRTVAEARVDRSEAIRRRVWEEVRYQGNSFAGRHLASWDPFHVAVYYDLLRRSLFLRPGWGMKDAREVARLGIVVGANYMLSGEEDEGLRLIERGVRYILVHDMSPLGPNGATNLLDRIAEGLPSGDLRNAFCERRKRWGA